MRAGLKVFAGVEGGGEEMGPVTEVILTKILISYGGEGRFAGAYNIVKINTNIKGRAPCSTKSWLSWSPPECKKLSRRTV